METDEENLPRVMMLSNIRKNPEFDEDFPPVREGSKWTFGKEPPRITPSSEYLNFGPYIPKKRKTLDEKVKIYEKKYENDEYASLALDLAVMEKKIAVLTKSVTKCENALVAIMKTIEQLQEIVKFQ